MREILFRGKDISNGEWVTGGLVQGVVKELWRNDNRAYIVVFPEFLSRIKLCEVIPETLGQFTGFTDKNGTKIFEGDYWIDEDGGIFVVEFRDGKFNFVIYDFCGCVMEYGWDETAGGFGECDCSPMTDYYIENIEIIGNIHDNPELLEV